MLFFEYKIRKMSTNPNLFCKIPIAFFSSAGEKSDSSGSSGSESPNRSQNNSDNGPQTWLGTLNGFDSENGRCPESSFHNPGPQLYTGTPGHTIFHEIQQETQYYYQTGSIIKTFLLVTPFSTSKRVFRKWMVDLLGSTTR